VSESAWEWDPSLYTGSACYYARGRVAYPAALADVIATRLDLDGAGRYLDVGCGPGSLTLLLAHRFTETIGVDADQDMLTEAGRLATEVGLHTTRWVRMRAEELPAGLGTFRLVTFAQSFHWLDRPRVAEAVHAMLDADGACAHVHAAMHKGVDTTVPLPHPRPPHEAIDDLVRQYLGPVRRAGRGVLPEGTATGESDIYRAAGFTDVARIEVPGQVVTRTVDDVVATVYSLSSSTPHLFGDRRAAFEDDLRRLLHDAGPDGTFSEQLREIAVDIWRP
jgi:hypothetical protein